MGIGGSVCIKERVRKRRGMDGEKWEAQSDREGLCQEFLKNFAYFSGKVYVSK